MAGGVAHTSADGAEGDEEGIWLLGVRPGGVPGGCREGGGGDGSRDVRGSEGTVPQSLQGELWCKRGGYSRGYACWVGG